MNLVVSLSLQSVSTVQHPSVITTIHPLHPHLSLTPLLGMAPVSSELAAGMPFPRLCQELGLPLCQRLCGGAVVL